MTLLVTCVAYNVMLLVTCLTINNVTLLVLEVDVGSYATALNDSS